MRELDNERAHVGLVVPMVGTGDRGKAGVYVEMAGGAPAGADACRLHQVAAVGETVGDECTGAALVGLLRGVEDGEGGVPAEPRGRELGRRSQHGLGQLAGRRVELAAICSRAGGEARVNAGYQSTLCLSLSLSRAAVVVVAVAAEEEVWVLLYVYDGKVVHLQMPSDLAPAKPLYEVYVPMYIITGAIDPLDGTASCNVARLAYMLRVP